jgi:hypothetical protein
MSLIGIVREQQAESRVAATPETVKVIRSLGYEVVVEKGAGEKASFPDSAYEAAGAKILPDSPAIICGGRGPFEVWLSLVVAVAIGAHRRSVPHFGPGNRRSNTIARRGGTKYIFGTPSAL